MALKSSGADRLDIILPYLENPNLRTRACTTAICVPSLTSDVQEWACDCWTDFRAAHADLFQLELELLPRLSQPLGGGYRIDGRASGDYYRDGGVSRHPTG